MLMGYVSLIDLLKTPGLPYLRPLFVAQVDARAHNKQTPLMWAMTRGHVQVA